MAPLAELGAHIVDVDALGDADAAARGDEQGSVVRKGAQGHVVETAGRHAFACEGATIQEFEGNAQGIAHCGPVYDCLQLGKVLGAHAFFFQAG